MDRYTIVVLLISLGAFVQRALREDVRWFPSLASPYRGLVVGAFQLVLGPALDSWSNGGEIWKTALTGLFAFLPTLLNVIVSTTRSIPPPKGGPIGLALLSITLALSGCAGSFEEARLAGRTPAVVRARASQPSDYCSSLDGKQMVWHAVAAGAGALSGASGLTAIPVGGDARVGLIAGSVTLSATAALAVVLADAASTAWARDCAEQPAGVR